MRPRNYDKHPTVAVPGAIEVDTGWDAVCRRVGNCVGNRLKFVLVIDTYPGTDDAEVLGELESRLRPALTIRTSELKKPEPDLLRLIGRNLTEDRIFGVLSCHKLNEFFPEKQLAAAAGRVKDHPAGLVLVYGVGASLICRGDLLVYADLARWEIQQRYRRGAGNWGAGNGAEDFFRKYKRGFFVEWRVADRHKFELFDRVDFFLDTHVGGRPRLVPGDAVRDGLSHTVTRPFRVVPFFDPAPWGGQWMKEVCELDPKVPNYGWCFDCVPEENSLLLGFGNERLEMPSLNLVWREPVRLLGDSVHARFGCEFPIRFDFLDTMGGGNLSFQVHPLTEYIQQEFGLHYTQDES
ncbi:MAG TPA: mannose-6-phosphate isomerase, partial [Verrucomicrobiae bacterium]|nr:mannose-6-phosphate isomerase [Verrucomicrobiae bacterium]